MNVDSVGPLPEVADRDDAFLSILIKRMLSRRKSAVNSTRCVSLRLIATEVDEEDEAALCEEGAPSIKSRREVSVVGAEEAGKGGAGVPRLSCRRLVLEDDAELPEAVLSSDLLL